jgi:signal peptidase I
MLQHLSKHLRRIYSSLLSILLILILLFIILKIRVIEIEGISMSPTLGHGDRCIMYKTKDVERGDIITIDMGHGVSYCKRVIGIGGDELFIWEHGILVNEALVSERYVLFYDLTTPKKTIKLKQNEIWVMGDNRQNSHDSRYFGPIKRSQVEGKLLWTFGRNL